LAQQEAAMRISGDPGDPDYVQDHPYVVVLNGQFFTGGPVIEADEGTGTIDFYPVDEQGNYQFDPATGTWQRQKIAGKVNIYKDMGTA
jgi:hypothetical protein